MKRAPILAGPILAVALSLAACEDQAAAPADQRAAAAGEVLEGSISDAMIPLEQLDSQAPLAPRQPAAPGGIDGEQPDVAQAPGVEGDPPSEATEAPPAAPAPAATE
jgi:hypothetical protein